MNKRERIYAAVNLQKTDRLPYSFWSHLPGIDLDATKLAEATYQFYKAYDLDFVKTMNNGMYPIEDFGCKIDYSEITHGGVAKIISTPVQSPEDWAKLSICSVSEGSLARELDSLKQLLAKVKSEHVPVVFTSFSPITIADKLCGKKVLEHIRQGHGDKVKQALEVIAETTANLAKAAIGLGADGIFFASQMSSYDITTPELYLEYGKPYDLQVLEAAQGGWMNTIHAHGSNVMFELLSDYPTSVFNWHAWETLPAIDEAKLLTGKCLMGGLNRNDITNCNRNAIRHQIYASYQLTGGRGLILTPGCVIRYPLNDAMLAYVNTAKEFVESRMRL
ncbi:MAG TPA: uroporphyrinogen decarboxylase family protein [Clostridia bacterium]|nr:uroporphyrinogen decarboxylase family protein [Clostridia bacterium]